MNQSLTISLKSLVLALLATVALVAAYLLGGVDDADAEEHATGGDERTVAMRGVGTVTAVPDQLSFTVAVSVTEDDVAPAMDAASATMARTLKVLGRHGVDKADTQSTGLGISPRYSYPHNAEPVLTGYRVNQRMRVVVTDLRKAGAAIGAVIDAGGNAVRVHGIALGLQDPDALLGEARDAAVEEATAKARQYAGATGQDLGGVLSLKEVSATPRRDQLELNGHLGRASAAFDAARMPIRAGEEELSVTVQVVWAFE